MDFFRRVNTFVSAGNFIWIGIGTALLYWVLESILHILFFGGQHFTAELINPNLHEIWKRILVISLLILFGIFAQQYFIFRQRSETALKESERKYRTIFEQAANPIFLFDDAGRFIDNNHAALGFMECSHDELLAKSFDEIAAGRSPVNYTDSAPTINEHCILEIDCSVNGNSKTMLLNLVPLKSEKNKFIYGIGQDITERKRMEKVLQQAYAELDQIFQTASVGMRVVDLKYNVMKINKTFAGMTNVTEEVAARKKCYEIFSGPMCRTVGCPISRVAAGESSFETYVDKKRPDGRVIPCILTAKPFSGPDGRIIGIIESFRDITQLKEAHEIISTERDKLDSILSNLLEGVSIINTDYTIEYQNKVFIEDFGDCKGNTCYSVLRKKDNPCDPCLMHEAIQSGKIKHLDYETADGRSYEHAYSLITDIDSKIRVVALIRDTTAKKTSLAIAMHADRLAAVGELAAGVAHEINNPINGIINYAQIISNKSENGQLTNNVAKRIIKESNRIARIVEGLLIFSRSRHDDKQIVSVNEILSDSLTLTSAQMRKDAIILKIDLAETVPQIMVKIHEIEQVFINVISNARYALNQKYPDPDNSKLLEITSQPITINHRSYARISFLDHGTGIPADIIDQAKNPFFTTKTEGKSTGLGLSISQEIVENHNGILTIDSKEERYTLISIDLPGWKVDTQRGE